VPNKSQRFVTANNLHGINCVRIKKVAFRQLKKKRLFTSRNEYDEFTFFYEKIDAATFLLLL
jgi:dsDNA-binding SOS-regulon protein